MKKRPASNHPGNNQAQANKVDAQSALFDAIISIQTREEARRFFKDLCTPAELQVLADRWLVVPLLNQEMSYRKIYETTGVSVTTVGRVARCYYQGQGGYQLIAERIEKQVHHENKQSIEDSDSKERAPI